jgi:hypothetical protein
MLRDTTTPAKYTIELFRVGGESRGHESILESHDDLTEARKLYKFHVAMNPDRLIMLCDRARVLARSDRPEPMLQ